MTALAFSPYLAAGGLTLSPSDLLSLFGTGISQAARLITLDSAQGSGLPDSLVVDRFYGTEGVNELFHFELDCLSVNTDLDLTQFIGEELTLRVLLPSGGGSYRSWHGYVTQAAWLGADGGLARYRLTLRPFLAFLGLRRDAFIFQDKDVLHDQPSCWISLHNRHMQRCAHEGSRHGRTHRPAHHFA